LTKYLPEIESSGLSVVGLVREDNQDAIHLHDYLYAPERGHLFAIADGMGGYSLGGVASKMALDSIANALFGKELPNPNALKKGVENANLRVYNTAREMGVARMGTTLTVAYLLGDTLHLAHVGDSRAYLIRQGRATCLTIDHTSVGEMVRAKLLSANKIRTHANRSILTRAVGIGLFVKPDITKHKLQEGDRIILCSDGVWSVIEDEEFALVANQLPVEKVSQTLVELALERETDDNASVVVFQINKIIEIPEKHAHLETLGWLYKVRKLTR
jgi:PPM family protein phosphatase